MNTLVIYPSAGLMGSTNVIAIQGRSLSEVRSMGRTARARYDLAVEVPACKYRGVHDLQFSQRDVPVDFRRSWKEVAA